MWDFTKRLPPQARRGTHNKVGRPSCPGNILGGEEDQQGRGKRKEDGRQVVSGGGYSGKPSGPAHGGPAAALSFLGRWGREGLTGGSLQERLCTGGKKRKN